MEEYISRSEAETRDIGRRLAADMGAGSVIALTGDLGCGKTAFVKGAAGFFGCEDDVTSPTYTLVNQYDGSVTIYHFDVYRLSHPSADECDWLDDYLFGDGICLIEWADNIAEILPDNTIWIDFEKDAQDESIRKIHVRTDGR